MKIRNVFASTQLRITRLRKYPIDPKAYLGHWNHLDQFQILANQNQEKLQKKSSEHT